MHRRTFYDPHVDGYLSQTVHYARARDVGHLVVEAAGCGVDGSAFGQRLEEGVARGLVAIVGELLVRRVVHHRQSHLVLVGIVVDGVVGLLGVSGLDVAPVEGDGGTLGGREAHVEVCGVVEVGKEVLRTELSGVDNDVAHGAQHLACGQAVGVGGERLLCAGLSVVEYLHDADGSIGDALSGALVSVCGLRRRSKVTVLFSSAR